MYHSHSDETKDTWAGLMGGMIFTGRWVWAGVGGEGLGKRAFDGKRGA